MATETEIERLLVRLIGDASSFEDMLSDSQKELTETAQVAEKSGSRIEAVGKSLLSAGKKIGLAGAAFSAAVTAPLTIFAKKSVDAFSVQEDAELTLRAALKANGRNVEKLAKQYGDFASKLQEVAGVGDETTLVMFRQSEALGVTGAAAERAVKNAVSLAAEFETLSSASALRLTVQLEQGDTTLLNRYLKTLKDIKDPAERVAEAQRLLGNMFSTAEAKSLTFAGRVNDLKNSFGDLQEQFGQIIADALKPFVAGMKQAVTWMQNLSPETKKVIVIVATLAASIGPILVGIGAFLAFIGAALPIIITGFGLVFSWTGLIITAIAAVGVAIGAVVAQLIGPQGFLNAWEAISKKIKSFTANTIGFFQNFRANVSILVDWFRENWFSLLKDLGRAWVTSNMNMLKNFGVALETLVRINNFVFGKISALIQKIFSKDMVVFVAKGVASAAQMVLDFARNVGNAVSNMFNPRARAVALSNLANFIGSVTGQANEDIKAGFSDEALFEGISRILGEQMEKAVSPLEGFKFETEGPELLLGKKFNLADLLGPASNQLKDWLVQVFGAGQQLPTLNIPVKFSTVTARDVGSFSDLAKIAEAELNAANAELNVKQERDPDTSGKEEEKKQVSLLDDLKTIAKDQLTFWTSTFDTSEEAALEGGAI